MNEKTRQIHQFFWLVLSSLISQRLVLLTRKKEGKIMLPVCLLSAVWPQTPAARYLRLINDQIDEHKAIFSKAFDTVPHKRLRKKLDHYGIRGQLIKWTESWLCERYQTVAVNGSQSPPVDVTSGVSRGKVLGSPMFLMYVNNIGLQITSE